MADCEKCAAALAAVKKAGAEPPAKRVREILGEWHRNGHPEVGADGPR